MGKIFSPFLLLLSSDQSLSSFQFVANSLCEKRSTGGPFYVDGVEIALIMLIECDSIFKGVSLRAFQQMFVLYIWLLLTAIGKKFFPNFGQVLLAHWHFGEKVGFMAIGVGDGGHISLACVGICPVVCELIVIHNKIILFIFQGSNNHSGR